MKKIAKKIIFSFLLLYTYNLIAVTYSLMIPINYITVGIITLLDTPGLFLLVLIFKLFYWG
jgi:pro-sigmaK processing inhibitor BofA